MENAFLPEGKTHSLHMFTKYSIAWLYYHTMLFHKKQLKNGGWFGKFSPLRHCEPVTDVTGVAIRSPLTAFDGAGRWELRIATSLRSSQ